LRYSGRAFRFHDPRWAWDAISGEGASTYGGRFNEMGVPTLYLGLQEVTALNEHCQGFGHRAHEPAVFVTCEVDCDDIEDLTNRATRRRLGVRVQDLGCAWLALANAGRPVPSRIVAARLRAAVAGIIVRSFAPEATRNSTNLVLWRWGDNQPHRVRVFDPRGRLSRNARSGAR
jgi:RES domain-containing protein